VASLVLIVLAGPYDLQAFPTRVTEARSAAVVQSLATRDLDVYVSGASEALEHDFISTMLAARHQPHEDPSLVPVNFDEHPDPNEPYGRKFVVTAVRCCRQVGVIPGVGSGTPAERESPVLIRAGEGDRFEGVAPGDRPP
jgi:hypothetical protein